jgi:tetratricopeptide (TPR) repeat protein
MPGPGPQAGRPRGAPTSAGARLALIALGVVFFALLVLGAEGALTLAGYGPPHRLFLKKKVLGEETYRLNREVSELFFPPWATKPPGFEQFPVQPAPGTVRLMATGESSTLGEPFGPQTAFPALLGEMLADAAPERRYEVANCAVVAISSLDVLLLHRQIVDLRPDAVLIYCGHNEAYGADGVDTPVQRAFATRRAAQAWLWFRNRRLVRLARQVFGQLRAAPPERAREGFGMWLMRDRTVPAHGAKHERLLEFYRENLRDMLKSARDRGVDVLLCTLISNERDQSPLGSVHGPDFDPAREGEWRAALARGTAAMERARWADGLAALDACRALDPDYPEVRFRRGRCLDALGDSAAAIREYVAARDLDAVHFRACSEQNEVVRELAREWPTQGRHRVVLIDLDRRIHEAFPHGADRRFFTEHVHPYPVGHAWIAREIARALEQSELAPHFGAWDLGRLAAPADYVRRVGMSDLDEATGLYLTDAYKMAKWPFTECYENDEMRAHLQRRMRELSAGFTPSEAQFFRELPTDRTGDLYDFGKRHMFLFTQFRNQRRGEEALRELDIARNYWWPEAFLETDRAQVLIGMKRLDEAEMHLRRARELDRDYAPIHFVAGALQHSRGNLPAARREFETYLRRDPAGPYAAAARAGLQATGGSPRGGR